MSTIPMTGGPLYFITSNKGKFDEAKTILPAIERLEIDLPEIQEIDPHVIVRAKLLEAQKHSDSQFIVEDTSLYIESLKGLPGPLYKWFERTIGNSGILEIIERYENLAAKAVTIVGYANEKKEMYFFDGVINGRIVPTSGSQGFSWDSIFQPEGSDKTFGDMTAVEKNTISMRRFAFEKLKDFLEKGVNVQASNPAGDLSK